MPDIAKTEADRAENAVDRQGWSYLSEMFSKWLAGPKNNKALVTLKRELYDRDMGLIATLRGFSLYGLAKGGVTLKDNGEQVIHLDHIAAMVRDKFGFE